MDSKLSKIINNIKQKYLSLGLTDKEITSIITTYFKSNQSETNAIDYDIEDELTTRLNEYIKNQIEDSNYDTILRYITSRLTLKDNKKDCISELNKIKEFCITTNITPDIDLYNELINSSLIIKELIAIIIAEHIEDIEQNKISKITKNQFVKELIEAYCVSSSLTSEYELLEQNDDSSHMIEDMYRQYLSEITKKPLTPEQEKEYWVRIKNGDKLAYDEFVECNLRLVISIAKRYHSYELDKLDLVQEGNIGLIKAMQKFSPDKGNKFSTYATWWIRQGITRAIADTGRTIRIPVHQTQKVAKYKKTIEELQMELKMTPTREQIRERLGWTEREYNRIEIDAQDVVSLNQLVGGEDNETELIEFIPTEELAPETAYLENTHEQEIILMFIRSSLTLREMMVLSKRNGMDNGVQKTLEVVGQMMGVTRERIRQIEAKALRKLKNSQEASALYNNTEIKIYSNKNTKVVLTDEEKSGYPKVDIDDIKKLVAIMASPRFSSITSGSKPFKNALMLGLRYGALNGKKYSIPAIATLFNVTYGIVLDTIYKTSSILITEYNKQNQENQISPIEEQTYLKKIFK